MWNVGTVAMNGTVGGYYSIDNATWLSMGHTRPISLDTSNETLLTFHWGLRAAGVGKSIYFMKFNATAIYETLTFFDEFFIKIKVRILSDSDGDNDVDVGDQRKVQLAMFSIVGNLTWNPNADVDSDGDVGVGDQRKQALHMFESW